MEQTYQRLLRTGGFFNGEPRQLHRGLPLTDLRVGRTDDAIKFLA